MQGSQYSPLTLAAQRGQPAEVRALLDAGAEIDEPDGDGYLALSMAARFGRLDVAELLLARGADANARQSKLHTTALMDASDKGHVEVVMRLLVAGADPTLRSKGGTTALKVARIYGNTEIASLLEQAGATE